MEKQHMNNSLSLVKEILLIDYCLSFKKKTSKWLLGKNFLVKSEGGKTPAPIKELMSRKCNYIIGVLSQKEIPIAHPEVPQYFLL